MTPTPPADLPTLPEPIFDAEVVEYRLRDAGAVLIALPGRGTFPAGYRVAWPADIVGAADAAVHDDHEMIRTPTPRRVTQMDEAFRWIALIPQEHADVRRIVLLRSLSSPRHGRPLHSWRRIGKMMSLEHRTVQARYARGIGWITTELYRQQLDRAPWAVSWEQARRVAGSLNLKTIVPDAPPRPEGVKAPRAYHQSEAERVAGIARFLQHMPGRTRAALQHFPGDGAPKSGGGGRGFGQREIGALDFAGFLVPGEAAGQWRLTPDGQQARAMLPGASAEQAVAA